MTLTVDSDAGLIWINGSARTTSQSIAKLVGLLYGRQGSLVTYEEIERALGITYHTRTAYLHNARKMLDGSGVRLRTVKGQGVVLEPIPEEVAAA